MMLRVELGYGNFVGFMVVSLYMSVLMNVEANLVSKNVIGWAYITFLTGYMGVTSVKHLQ